MMTRTLDRMLFGAFVRSYLIVLTCLLSLYVVIDLFTNLDDFVRPGGLAATAEHIARYYGPRLAQIYDKLAEAVTLLAAMFTVSWMQRNNELLPQLSAGVPTHRVIRPVMVGAALVSLLAPLNQEFVIPRVADRLQVPKDDPDQERPIEMKGAFDSTGVHLEGVSGYRKDLRVKDFFITLPETSASGMSHVTAAEAVYVPHPDPRECGWHLYNTTPEVIPDPVPEVLRPLGPRQYFLRTRDVEFDSLTKASNFYSLASTAKLRQMLDRPDGRRLAPVAVLFHMRFVRPLVAGVLVVLGLSIILKDQNRHVLISAGLCLVMCAIFYAAVFGCKYLGENDLLAAPLAAWLPVLLFGPVALVQFDAIHT